MAFPQFALHLGIAKHTLTKQKGKHPVSRASPLSSSEYKIGDFKCRN